MAHVRSYLSYHYGITAPSAQWLQLAGMLLVGFSYCAFLLSLTPQCPYEVNLTKKNYKQIVRRYVDYCRREFNVQTFDECKGYIQTYSDFLQKEGYTARTLYFNDGDKAYNKFLDIVAKEEDMIRVKKNRAGYDTENIVEIDAVLTKEILDSYGTYDTVSGNIITQILFLRNPEAKAS